MGSLSVTHRELPVFVIGEDEERIAETTASLVDQLGPRSIVVCRRVLDAFVDPGPDVEFFSVVLAGTAVAPGAVAAVSDCLLLDPKIDVVFGDESEQQSDGSRRVPRYKSAWSPERLAAINDFSGFTTYRSGLVDPTSLGEEADVRAQLHDLALLASERSQVVAHLPRVLCHSVGSPGAVHWDERLAVVNRHFARCNVPALSAVVDKRSGAMGFVPGPLADPPLVSVIIPTGGGRRRIRGRDLVLISNALESLLAQTTYPNLEVVVVLDRTSDEALAAHVTGFDPARIRTVKDDRPFNFSAACNLGVEAARGEVCVLLNDDTEVIDGGWVERIVALLQIDGVGVVGTKLLYGDGRVQHAGVARRRGLPDHVAHGYPGDDLGDHGWLGTVVNCFATTGACLSVRRSDWIAVGGMDPGFPFNFNDVDLCLRLRKLGLRVVVDNQTVLTHLESSSRSSGSEQWEVDRFLETWPSDAWPDTWDSPNFVHVGMERIPVPLPLAEARCERHGPPTARIVRRQ